MTHPPPPIERRCRPAGRPAGHDAADTRDALLTAARTAFAERGYDGTSLREVAAVAGVSLPTVYHHFGSKAGVFAAAYQDADRTLLATLERAVDGHATLRGRLVAMAETAAALHHRDPTVAAMLSVGQIETARNADLAGARGPGGRAVPALITRVVADAAEAGELPDDADLEGVVALLSAMALGVALTAAVLAPAGADALFEEWRRLVAGELLP